MRKTKDDGNLTMRAFAGTHVVLLGWSMTKLKSRRVLGFAVHRTDHTEGEAFWLKGIKVFEETDPGTAQASLRSHPVQGFTWSDFTTKPSHEYTYRVAALKGQPSDLHDCQLDTNIHLGRITAHNAVHRRQVAEMLKAPPQDFRAGAVAPPAPYKPAELGDPGDGLA